MDLTPLPDDFVVYGDRLRAAVADLWYPSESEAPVTVVIWAVDRLDAATVAEQVGCGVADVVARSPEDWFQPILANDFWRSAQGGQLAQRYEALRDLLWSTLTDLQAYQIGTIEQDLYLMGRHPDGGYVGVQTQAVAT